MLRALRIKRIAKANGGKYDKLHDEESLYSAAQEFAQAATEILTETIDAKEVFNILRDWYNHRAGRDDPKADGQARARREGDRSAEADRSAEEATASLRASRDGR